MVSNNKIGPILEKIKTAAKPSKFTNQFLRTLGFTSTNDRAVLSLLKRLGFLTDDGSPTAQYDRLKDSTQHKYVIGEQIKDLYRDLYNINESIHSASEDEIKGAFSRITGKDEKLVNYYYATFKSLVNQAKFDGAPTKKVDDKLEKKKKEEDEEDENTQKRKPRPDFHYNIQIHLPATTDISVYNAIFKSLKENLLA
jgi:hypothetical protein